MTRPTGGLVTVIVMRNANETAELNEWCVARKLIKCNMLHELINYTELGMVAFKAARDFEDNRIFQRYVFNDRPTAMMFKLTFGGDIV